MTYQVEKWNVDKGEKIADYGYLSEADLIAVTKGYKLADDDGIMRTYSRKNGNYLYFAIRTEVLY